MAEKNVSGNKNSSQPKKKKKKKKIDYRQMIIDYAPFVIIGVFASNIPQGFRLGWDKALEDLSPSFHIVDLLGGLCVGACLKLFIVEKGKNAKKYRPGEEHGTARWGDRRDIAPFKDDDFQENVILTQSESLMMNPRPPEPKYARNKNVLIVGGSGSGKTRFWLKPNLMQMHSSYVVTDPKGSILIECGKMLQRGRAKKDSDGEIVYTNKKNKKGEKIPEYEPYDIKVFNTIEFEKSMKYNPLKYINSDKDILKLANTFITNTKGEGKGGDDFWVKAETMLYCALIGYLYYECLDEDRTFSNVAMMIDLMEVKEDDDDFKNAIDYLFEDLAKEEPTHFAVRQYNKYKLSAGKTAKSILVSCGARLAPFDIKEIRDLTSADELNLDELGDNLSALFFIISDTDDTFNFLVSMAYTQLFNLLCEKADKSPGNRLKHHVRCLIDECANIGQIPKLEKLIATIRSREISACLVLQAQSQLKAIYKDNAETIIGNCDSVVFLGGKEKSTLEELNKTLGKETIDTFNTSDTRGQSRSMGLNYQKLGKELMTLDELAVMDGERCILQLRGVRPFFSYKYDITKHPNYKYLSDYNPINAFDIGKYVNKRRRLIKEEEKQKNREQQMTPKELKDINKNGNITDYGYVGVIGDVEEILTDNSSENEELGY